MYNFVEINGKYCLLKNCKPILEFTEQHNQTKIMDKKGNQVLAIGVNGKIQVGPNLGKRGIVTTIEEFNQVPIGFTFSKSDGNVYFKKNNNLSDSIALTGGGGGLIGGMGG